MNLVARPVRVYLDTSDYNELAKDETEHYEIKKFLLDGVEDGRIITGYSYPIIFELFRKYDDKHKPERMRIARFLKTVCRSNAFPYLADLRSGATFPNNGIWMPLSALEFFSPKKLKDHLWSGIRTSIDKEDRLSRTLKRKLRSKSGYLDIARELPFRELKKSDFANIPVSEDLLLSGHIQGYFRGSVSANILSRELTRWVSDPESFIQLWYEYSGKENPLEKLVDNLFKNLMTSFENFKIQKQKVEEAYKAAKIAHSNIHRHLHNSDLPKELISSVKLPERPRKPQVPDANLRLDDKFGIGRGGHFDHYFNALRDGRISMAPSDFIDLVHLVYLKDVDLMRCDRRMANLMRNCPSIDSTKIVGSLRDLPAAIQRIGEAL